jgi:cytochrome c-type biogenesis protein
MVQNAAPGIAISFTAGLLSFLSPCVLPLIPSYISFITGMKLEDVQRSRRTALIHSLLFIAGFTLIFLALGATASAVGILFHRYREWVTRVGGVLVIVLGLYLLGVLKIGAFSRDRRVYIADKPLGYFGTVVVGMAFAAGWTPCLGPILGMILELAAIRAELTHGLTLLFAYSLGLAVPFLLAALMIDRFMAAFQRFRGGIQWVSRISGVLLIAVGILMVTDNMALLTTWLQQWTPEFLYKRL